MLDEGVTLTNPTLRSLVVQVSGNCCSLSGSTYVRLGPFSSQTVRTSVDSNSVLAKNGQPVVGVQFAARGLDHRIALRLPEKYARSGGKA